MTEMFIIFFQLPFEKGVYKIISISEKIQRGKDITLPIADVSITINLWDYLSDLDKPYNLSNTLFDLNSARRLLEGKPKGSFQKNNEPWNGIKILGRSFDDNKLFGKIKSIEESKYSTFDEWEKRLPPNWEVDLITSFKKEYNNIVSELKKYNLYDNFINIEMRLLVSFIKANDLGIKLNKEKFLTRCLELDRKYYQSVRKLEIDYNYIVSDFRDVTFETIREYIKDCGEADFSKKYIWDSIELYRNVNSFLDLLYIENHTKRDLSELLRMTAGISDRCKLQYDIIGTVSGRILITRPGIQYLKRASRDIFVPHEGNRFIYADYSQFEPGIMAYLSDDQKLRKVYVGGDLYSNLASAIGADCTRDIAKKMFLSYIYGMSIDNIKKSIIQNFGTSAGSSIASFLNEFPNVLKWKDSVVEKSFKDKIAIGLTGYIRHFSEDDHKSEIARWAPNHVIQSTASGIFKNALIRYLNTARGRMLVPMHDAILIEVESEIYEQERENIYTCMIESFETICPGIKCKVHFDNFSLE
jgi:DNA polymerase-1